MAVSVSFFGAARTVILDDYYVPCAGLGLAIAHGFTGEEFAAAIRAVTVPPAVDLGLRFPDLPGGGNLNILGYLFDRWQGSDPDPFPGAPSCACPALRGLDHETQLVPLIPIVDLPATGDYWVVVEHFSLLLRRLAVGDIDVGALPPWRSGRTQRGSRCHTCARGRTAT